MLTPTEEVEVPPLIQRDRLLTSLEHAPERTALRDWKLFSKKGVPGNKSADCLRSGKTNKKNYRFALSELRKHFHETGNVNLQI
ncbi:hypothetical protein CDAR_549891 [Caerostris darwini]|uniref:RNase H type-1 domain-containing protein n=1 Tax=Caerostris darwini TaxID=1538125 RepID=A0AAV4QEC5_9ARAC|nr:hypothetical protein CDAR_549891 [Caerostris darwini]